MNKWLYKQQIVIGILLIGSGLIVWIIQNYELVHIGIATMIIGSLNFVFGVMGPLEICCSHKVLYFLFRITFVLMTVILMLYWQVYKKFDTDKSFHVQPIVMLVVLLLIYLWMYTLHPIPIDKFSGRYTLATHREEF